MNKIELQKENMFAENKENRNSTTEKKQCLTNMKSKL